MNTSKHIKITKNELIININAAAIIKSNSKTNARNLWKERDDTVNQVKL